MLNKLLKSKALMPFLLASAVCGATLYALSGTLSFLFRDVEE